MVASEDDNFDQEYEKLEYKEVWFLKILKFVHKKYIFNRSFFVVALESNFALHSW